MHRSLLFRTAVLLGTCAGFVLGCSDGTSTGQLPETKPATQESLKEDAKKLEMMKGSGYKGAPGIPLRK